MAFIRQHRSDWLNAMTSTLWDGFRSGACQLFVWEAFISGSEKAYPPSHSGNAALAISAFLQVSSNNDNPTRIRCSAAFSLTGAAVVWSGLSENLDLLKVPCVVLRPLFSKQEAQGRLTGAP
jgi:hypothetical protein